LGCCCSTRRAQNGCSPTAPAALADAGARRTLRNATSAPRRPSTELRGNLAYCSILAAAGLQCATSWFALIRNRRACETSLFVSFTRPRAYSATPHENTAKPACTRQELRDISLASWATRGLVRSNQSLQRPLLHAPSALKREWMAAATHASTSPASPRNRREHHKLLFNTLTHTPTHPPIYIHISHASLFCM
jgi:hypothetical protein